MRLLYLCSLLLATATLHAQTSKWNKASTAKKTLTTKAERTHKRLKDFKNHLQQWGLDTVYQHAFLAGGCLNTDGWSGNLYFVKRKNYTRNRIWEISLGEIKHEKQNKQQGTNKSYPELGKATPYVYGKLNNAYTLQLGYSTERLLLPGVLDGNLSVSMRYTAGLSLALLKPYYLKMMNIDYTTTPETATLLQDKYNRTDSALYMNPNRILGAATWSTGLKETEVIPGGYASMAIALSPGKSKTFVQCITLGVQAIAWYKPLPLLQGQQAYPWRVCLFAGLAVGKRW